MTSAKQMVRALEYLDDEVNSLYRLAPWKGDTSGLSQQDIDSLKRSISSVFENFQYFISDRCKEMKE